MGMYTELNFNVRLKEDTPKNIIAILEYMCDNNLPQPDIDEHHALFESFRWSFMLQSDSYYFDADTHSTIRFDSIAKQYYLNVQCNLKNYENEIKKFVEWIMPHIDGYEGKFLGYWRYEEDEEPTLIYMK